MAIEYTPEQTSMMDEIKSRSSGASGMKKKMAMQRASVVAGPKPRPVSSSPSGPSPMDQARTARLRAAQDRQSTGTGSFRRPSSY